MNDPLMVVLRLLHIGFGVMWVGAAWMLHFFVTPTLRALGPETEREFTAYILRRRRLATTILIATVITVGAGLTMLVIDINRYGVEQWFGSAFGIGITIGASAAMVSFLLGPLIIIPLANRMEKLATDTSEGAGANADEFVRVRDRLGRVLAFDSGLLIVAVLFMAISRYL